MLARPGAVEDGLIELDCPMLKLGHVDSDILLGYCHQEQVKHRVYAELHGQVAT